ncbi:DUF167 family protein YggU [Pseudoalteromonas tunicata]|uniref:DUF167 family protein YggU n=1 Tax=Pseudoalteromonas tunicata TaxID=314281 RepID=UPI00273EE523|nr:DUF167 family protein YggU [Pseudoalteromonas tunicata]MDP5211813.1 DUF167 family protein YggU [Pseudoalteromonas tunicata]
MSAVAWQAEILTLRLYVQPKASQDKFIGLHGNELKVAITAPPVDGQANSHLIKFLAKQCKVAKNQVCIKKGLQGRHKEVQISKPEYIPTAISTLIANSPEL